MENKNEQRVSVVEKLSEKLTTSIGTPTSIVVHTILFASIFGLQNFGIALDQILLILTTAVSLEAIYLAIFIQMTVNRQTLAISEVSEDLDEISEDVDEISKDVDEISKDIDEIQEDIGEIEEEVDEISKDVDELSEDIEEEDVDDLADRNQRNDRLQKIEDTLHILIKEIGEMKERK